MLQVGHHGSKTSTSEYLLSQVRPDVAIISSGRWNPWKFPHYSVMERLHRYKSAVENTAVSGQVRVNFFSRPIRNPASSHKIFPLVCACNWIIKGIKGTMHAIFTIR